MSSHKSFISYLFAIVLAGSLAFVWGAPGATAGSTNTSRSLSLSEQVHHDLAMLPWYGVFDNLEYQVNGTEVTLKGQLISRHAVTKDDAQKAVSSIPGVTKVINNIQILPPSRFDDQIRRAEYRTIFSKADLGRYTMGAIPQIHIIVNNGHVSLDGEVMNQMDKNIAGIAANSVPDVFSVQNNLKVG